MGVKRNSRPLILLTALGFCSACRRSERPVRRALSSAVASPVDTPRRFERASFPVFDVHTHIEPSATARALAIFDERNVRMAVNLSGGAPGDGLEEALAQQQASGGRIIPFCLVDWRGVGDPGWLSGAIATLEGCAARGVKGWKIPKVLGLAAGDGRGNRLRVDDPQLDPLFERAGALGLVVLIHSGDPRAFFDPPTPDNERWDELRVHPNWSFAHPRFPRWTEVLTEFENRVLRHPNTRFIGAHFGNAAEDPDRVERLLERAPHYYIDTAARIPEFGRHDPERMRRFFLRWQDRILFGTDLGLGPDPRDLMLGSTGEAPPTPAEVTRFWTATFRYFETRDRRFEHPTPIQGRWTIDGIGLPPDVLRKVYGANAARLLGVPWPQG
jgi:predicted TIM-barrel fold metal-dependent hydrolase